MKERTEAILRAAENKYLLACLDGVCNAIYMETAERTFDHWNWFAEFFSPNEMDEGGRWIGELDAKRLNLRFLFIAMAAAVSETED